MHISRRSILILMLTSLLATVLGFMSLAVPNMATAESAISATSSFKKPKGCKNARALARAFKAVQACERRFSPTHEFVIILLEKRYKSDSKSSAQLKKSLNNTVKRHLSDLKKANQTAPGRTLGIFERENWSETEDYYKNRRLPEGADYCEWATAAGADHRVPNYVGQEFRFWVETRVCARFDPTTSTIQLVELRASERFRVTSDGPVAVKRFKSLTPAKTALEAGETLKLF